MDEQLHEVSGTAHQEYLDLFKDVSFSEKWRRVANGLKQPKDSGEYKFARLQVIRLSAPASAVVVPIIALLVIGILAAVAPPPMPSVQARIMEPDKPPPVEEPPKKEPPPVLPDERDVEVNDIVTDIPMPGPPKDFSPQPADMDTVAIIKSPVTMRGIYGSRSPGARGDLLGRHGAQWTDAVVMRALRWLKKNQNPDGSWEKNKCAMTALALLTYLAHGETPASPEFGQTVEKAIRFLLDAQQGDGRFSPRDDNDYTHPIVAYALSEAYGMTKVPMLKDAATKAMDVIIAGQNPNGAFDYKLIPNDKRHDTSYMGWCAQALKAAKMAGLENAGLDNAIRKSIDGFKNNFTGNAAAGEFYYTGPPMPRNPGGLTSVGVLCLQLLGAAKSDECKGGLISLQKSTYNWEGGGVYNKLYYWYYTTQALFHHGGDTWTKWNATFAPVLAKNQIIIKDGIMGPEGKMVDIGYWTLDEKVSGHTDPEKKVMNTCLSTLQLEVYYRYLPTFKPPEELDLEAADSSAGGAAEVDVSI
ncbi:MAG: terpene cyclase/mutase family protein [Lentisphaerae bacterium]|nr:terpene cyclase/mutase family protein [Lentisphaerota bacterium]